MTEQISHYRKYFNIDEDVAYLNSAYMGLLPKESVLRGSQGFELKSKSWNIHWEDFYIRPENTRKLFSKLIPPRAKITLMLSPRPGTFQ